MRQAQATNRLARRAILAGVAAGILAAVMAGPAPHGLRARADGLPVATTGTTRPAETWVCTEATSAPAQFPLELTLRDGILSEQPHGLPRYRLLADTNFAIIGADHYGDFDPVLNAVSIFVSTVVIDRTTGSFITTTTVSGGPPQYRTGRCRRFEAHASPARDGALARR